MLGTGILLAVYFPDLDARTYFWILPAGLLVYVAVVLANRWGWIKLNAAWPGIPLWILTGYLLTIARTEAFRDHHLVTIQPCSAYEAVVDSDPEHRPYGWRMEVRVTAVLHDSVRRNVCGRVMLLLNTDSATAPLDYGDRIWVRGSLQAIAPPANPGEFDYRAYQAYRQIHHQHRVKLADVHVAAHGEPSWMQYAIACKHWVLGVLAHYIQDETALGVAQALVVGVREGLDPEIVQAYAATGALHVLAVSGLHVGIVYGLLLMLLRPLRRVPHYPWLVAVVSVLVLWGYAFVTGLSPSVLRAVTMFSFVAVAKPMRRSTSVYNTLAASALCLLVYDPYMIMSVGFQLSYLAVLGIVYVHPWLYQRWNPEAGWVDKVWELSSMSIAAQVATLPISLYYFHQFPVYFLLANMFVIPASSLILIGALALLVLHLVPVVASLWGVVIQYAITWNNAGIRLVESLPGSVVEGISLTPIQTVLLSAVIVVAIVFIQFRRYGSWVTLSVFVILFCGVCWMRLLTRHDQISVYSVNHHTAIDLFHGDQVCWIADSALVNNRALIQRKIYPGRILQGVHDVQLPTADTTVAGIRYVCWRGVRIACIQARTYQLPRTLRVDYLVLSNNAVRQYKAIADVNFTKVIVDSSNSFYFAEQLLKQAPDSTKIHSVLHQGAFIKTLD